jgi:PAS domain S-box-containing protein
MERHLSTNVTGQEFSQKNEESEAELKRFKFMADNAQDSFILMRQDGSFAYLNQKALDTWGFTEEEVKNIKVPDVDPVYHHQAFIEIFKKAQTEAIAPFETLHKKKSGEIFPVEVNLNSITLGNEPHLFAIARDITERKKAEEALKQSEQNLRNIILQSPVAMCILIGPNHVIEVANDSMVKLWGKQREDVMNKPVFEALPEAKEQGLEEILLKVYNSGETFKADERALELFRNGKIEMTYQNFVYEPYRAAGVIVGVLAVSFEVTEQVLSRQKIEEVVIQRTKELAETNKALIKSNDDLKKSNVNLEEFAYAASHDLKEPIRKIHFFSERIKDSMIERMNEDERHYFERLSGAAKRMNSLIDDLLSYSQISIHPRTYEEVNMSQLIEQVLEDLDLEIEHKNADVKVDDLFTIKGHHRQLQQAFLNLIGNALKYNKPGINPVIKINSKEVDGTDIDIPLSSGENQQNYYCISVADNGIGFEQADAERIFNVFTRLHGLTEYRGTGIGLSIVRKVIENHNGFITAESNPGVGSVFKIYLPKELKDNIASKDISQSY